MRLSIIVAFCCLSLTATAGEDSLTRYVNPLIGTHKMGHTYPGATAPFGMVQLSPDTDTLPYAVNGRYNGQVYRYCAGYQYDDPTITGFSHTHFSGTGHSDLGDLLVVPTTGPLQLNPGTADRPGSGYRSAFSHSEELARPGYYRVRLKDHNIRAELSASTRVGMHRYTFPASDSAHIVLDLVAGIYHYDQKNVWTFLRMENDTLLTGYRQTSGWARTRTLYFAIRFSKPVASYGFVNYDKSDYRGFWRKFDQVHNFPEAAGRNIKAHFDFKTREGEAVLLKVALSPVSTKNALENMEAEIPHWDLDRVAGETDAAWNKELARVSAELDNKEDKVSFYTALYHSFLAPTVYMDVNGEYKGLDGNVHRAQGFTNYTTFSLWDTYRALHPLFNLLQPRRNADMARSMLAHYEQSVHHMLPVWSHHANENWCMIGYHSVPVIVDAVLNGNNGIDAQAALDACVATARHASYDGLGAYMKLGYVPEDQNGSSVSKTLEYAYDDWCIAQLAKKLGRTEVYEEFSRRAAAYKNVFDPATGYMRPRLGNGSWRPGFDPLRTDEPGFIEGNSWNYSLYVPHQPDSLVAMMGGKKRFAAHLDSLFTMQLPDSFFAHTEDISRDGIIGNYVHGNEPSHHVSYLYNFCGQPWKTQQRVRDILKKMYRAAPDGLGGNDDCGQMSAWYLFSSLGFYPVCPGSGRYELGSPLVRQATLQLENGKTLHIEAKGQGTKNVYVRSVLLNGRRLDRSYITYDEIMQGGTLVFEMSAKPGK